MSTETSIHCRLRELLGRIVRIPSGEEVGRVEDFVVRLDDHSLCYAALSLAADEKGQERWVAVPCQALTLHRDADQVFFLLQLGREELEKVPSFDPRHWPAAVDPGWVAGTYRPTSGKADEGALETGRKDRATEAATPPSTEQIGTDALVDRLFTGPSGPGGPDKTKDF